MYAPPPFLHVEHLRLERTFHLFFVTWILPDVFMVFTTKLPPTKRKPGGARNTYPCLGFPFCLRVYSLFSVKRKTEDLDRESTKL